MRAGCAGKGEWRGKRKIRAAVRKDRKGCTFRQNQKHSDILLVCPLDRFTKAFFWNFQNVRAVLCYILIDKQMLEKVFCSNIAPSLSSGNHLFYKAEYMGRSCPNQVWAITFDWSALATWNKHFWTAFWKLFSGIPHLPGLSDVPGARCWHLAPALYNMWLPELNEGAIFEQNT